MNRADTRQAKEGNTMTSSTDNQIKAHKRLAVTVASGRVTWHCMACGKPITPGRGYIELDRAKAWAHEAAWKKFFAEQQHPWFSFADTPKQPTAIWKAWHQKCDPNPSESDYWIAVERIGTLAQVIHWAGHLSGKTWIDHTNWDQVLFKVSEAAESGPL